MCLLVIYWETLLKLTFSLFYFLLFFCRLNSACIDMLDRVWGWNALKKCVTGFFVQFADIRQTAKIWFNYISRSFFFLNVRLHIFQLVLENGRMCSFIGSCDWLFQNTTEQFIDKICTRLPTKLLSQQCEAFVNEYGEMVIDLLAQKLLNPKTFCTEIRLCNKATGVFKLTSLTDTPL